MDGNLVWFLKIKIILFYFLNKFLNDIVLFWMVTGKLNYLTQLIIQKLYQIMFNNFMEWKKNDSHFCLLMVFQSPVWRSIWSGTCQADGPDLISPFTRNCRPGFIIHGPPARLSVNSQYMPWFVLNSKTTSEVEKWIKILKRCSNFVSLIPCTTLQWIQVRMQFNHLGGVQW